MSKVPLKKTFSKSKEDLDGEGNEQINAYDIILGKIDIVSERIPTYIAILDKYESSCAEEARYVEAEMAKHKKDELRTLAKNIEKEKTINTHLKEKVEVEEAYMKEFGDFQRKWKKKLLKFEEKVESSKKDMLDHQQQ